MPDRKYSVAEIDRMRDALRWSFPSGVSFYEAERKKDVEDRLRTYMLNGTEPEELEAALQQRFTLNENTTIEVWPASTTPAPAKP